jgi:hypothetical protein
MWTTMKSNIQGKKCLSCSIYLSRFRKYLFYGFPIINFCNLVVHYEMPCIWVCLGNSSGLMVICVFLFIVFCLLFVLCFIFFIIYIFIYILICFNCTSWRTTAAEWKFNCSRQKQYNKNKNKNKNRNKNNNNNNNYTEFFGYSHACIAVLRIEKYYEFYVFRNFDTNCPSISLSFKKWFLSFALYQSPIFAMCTTHVVA